jgi:hypothetical protein
MVEPGSDSHATEEAADDRTGSQDGAPEGQ